MKKTKLFINHNAKNIIIAILIMLAFAVLLINHNNNIAQAQQAQEIKTIKYTYVYNYETNDYDEYQNIKEIQQDKNGIILILNSGETFYFYNTPVMIIEQKVFTNEQN